MKHTLVSSIIAVAISSCTIATSPTAGTYASLGGDADGIVFTPQGFAIAHSNNSRSFAEAKKAVTTYFYMQALDKAIGDLRGFGEAKLAADVSKHSTTTAAAVETAKINAATETAKLSSP